MPQNMKSSERFRTVFVSASTFSSALFWQFFSRNLSFQSERPRHHTRHHRSLGSPRNVICSFKQRNAARCLFSLFDHSSWLGHGSSSRAGQICDRNQSPNFAPKWTVLVLCQKEFGQAIQCPCWKTSGESRTLWRDWYWQKWGDWVESIQNEFDNAIGQFDSINLELIEKSAAGSIVYKLPFARKKN